MSNERTGSLVLSGISLSAQLAGSMSNAATPSLAQEQKIPHKKAQMLEYSFDLQERLAVEGAWLKIPGSCKDRSISSDPKVIGLEQTPESLAIIHAQLAEG